MDASNLLKPALARGELHCVGATTLDEYRKHVEKDAALARRFQPVFVAEPTVEDTVSILRGLKEKYEVHHGVRISDAPSSPRRPCPTATSPTAFLPDKAIDLIDEAASRVRMAVDSKPEALDEIDRRHGPAEDRARGPEEAKPTRRPARHRLEKLAEELRSPIWKAESDDDDRANGSSEKDKVGQGCPGCAKPWTASALELANAQRRRRPAAVRPRSPTARSPRPRESSLEEAEDERRPSGRGPLDPRGRRRRTDRRRRLAAGPACPSTRCWRANAKNCSSMEDSRCAWSRRRSGRGAGRRLRRRAPRPRRPERSRTDRWAAFLFLGPTGVGKTELTKALADFLFDDESGHHPAGYERNTWRNTRSAA